jgi:DNA repair protein RadD
MQLRDYQQRAIDEARKALATVGNRRKSVLLVSPTGSGKTVIGAEIARSAVARGRRVLWLAHRSELISQASQKLTNLGLDVGLVSASHSHGVRPSASVQVASVDTLAVRNEWPPAVLIIVDEAHHGAARTWRGILDAYPSATVVGLTATPQRSDGSGLGGDLFSRLVVVTTPRELEAEGHLVPMEVIRPAKPLRAGQIAQRPVDAWTQHARGRQTIVFCASVEHANAVCDEFNTNHYRTSAVIDSKTHPDSRASLLEQFRRGILRALCNVAVLTEGTDLPNTSCIIIARGCGTPGLWMQMTGRGSRPHPGKRDCIVLDLRGVSHEHGHPYDPREYSLEGRGIAAQRTTADQSYCRVCGAPIEAGAVCAECGVEARSQSVTVTGDRLEKYAHVQQFTGDQRAKMLATLMRKHPNRKQAFFIYSKMAGRWPDRPLQQKAEELLAS